MPNTGKVGVGVYHYQVMSKVILQKNINQIFHRYKDIILEYKSHNKQMIQRFFLKSTNGIKHAHNIIETSIETKYKVFF